MPGEKKLLFKQIFAVDRQKAEYLSDECVMYVAMRFSAQSSYWTRKNLLFYRDLPKISCQIRLIKTCIKQQTRTHHDMV